MPDPVDVDSIAEAANSPQSASVDGRSATAVPIDQQLKALDRLEANEALSGTNASGGPVSGFSKLRMAKYRNCGGPQ